MALLGKIAPGDIAIGINALQEAILACQEFEMSKSVTIDSYKYDFGVRTNENNALALAHSSY